MRQFKDDIWDIKNRQQTQIKLDILRKYLKAWAIIIGSHFPKAYFIDCFAGRGRYHWGEERDKIPGSPIIGIETSLEVRKIKQKKNIDFDLNVIAIDSDRCSADTLRKFAKDADPDSKTKIEVIESDFDNALPGVLSKISIDPAFFFIDPYGIKGVGKKSLDLIVDRIGSTEIFLNYMKMGVQRVKGQYKNIKHEDEKIRIRAIKTTAHMDTLFGDASWVDKTESELLKHFVGQTFSKNYKFVLNFNVPYPDRSGTIYNLLFATNYDCGEKIMRDIMTARLFKGTLFEKCPFKVEWNIK
jgi:three-Cys-motif partner protein